MLVLPLSMEFISEQLQNYANEHTSDPSRLLMEIDRDTHLEVLKPRMLSGHFQGRLLALFSNLLKPNRILEIGTYTGYSALCLAEGLSEHGKLFTIDVNEELENRVRSYFSKSTYHSKIEFILGDALACIERLNEVWDLVFIDADKANYLNYYNAVIEKVRPGGMIILDNVLWSGKVVEETCNDTDTNALREVNTYISNDSRVSQILLPVRDGLMVVIKNG